MVDAAIQLVRHDEPIDTRDGQLVYIKKVAGIAKLERDGRIEECHEDALAGIPGVAQGTNYLKHDLVFEPRHRTHFFITIHVGLIICALHVFLPTNTLNVHWFLVVVNPRRKEIQVLDSLFHCMVHREVNNMVRILTSIITTKDLTPYVIINRKQLLIVWTCRYMGWKQI